MYNKIILAGNLTRDIELRYTQGGAAIANTAIATSHKYTHNGEKKEEVCFIDITFFGRSAEVANQYLKKGSKILVEGRLKHDTWTDNEGNKKSKHGVIVESMQMLGTKQNATEQQHSNEQNTHHGHCEDQSDAANSKPHYTDYRTPTPQPKDARELDFDGEEIPF